MNPTPVLLIMLGMFLYYLVTSQSLRQFAQGFLPHKLEAYQPPEHKEPEWVDVTFRNMDVQTPKATKSTNRTKIVRTSDGRAVVNTDEETVNGWLSHNPDLRERQ